MLDQRLAVDPFAFGAGAADRLVRLAAGDMHDVERRAGLIGQHDGAVGGLALDVGRTRQRVAFRSRHAFGEVELLQGGDEVAVLGVHKRQRAEFGAARERGEHLLVVDHQRALVGHEMFEAGHTMRDHGAHVLAHFVGPIGDAHVIGVVGGREFGALVPGGDGVHQRLAAVGDAEVDHHRRAARQRRFRAGVVIVGR